MATLQEQFYQKALRLRRTDWPNPSMLADEIFSIFRSLSDIIAVIENGKQTTGGGDTTNINEGSNFGGTTVTIGDETIQTGFGPNYGAIEWPGQNANDGDAATPNPANNPIVLYGEIVAKISGSMYSVRCYAKDPSSSPPVGVLTVRQGLINPDETIPAGTPVVVIAFPTTPTIAGSPLVISSAVMQVPVWLE